MKKMMICFFASLFIFLNTNGFAQKPDLSGFEKSQVIDSTCAILLAHYIDLNKAEEMVRLLRTNHSEHKYDEIKDYSVFARQIEEDLAKVAEDKHFHFMYDPKSIARSKETGTDETLNQLLADRRINFGYREVKILDGNVGYLKLDRFPYPHDAKDAIVGSLSMLSNADAIIIDMSDNRGGYNESVQLLMSAFNRYPVLINTIYERFTDQSEQFWTYPYLHGKVLDSVDVYIITSSRTFSAGEWFTYSMQQNKKAIVVGEVTKGGATPSAFFYLNDHYMMLVPNKKAICPVSKTNFNNTGVQPDVSCAHNIAFHTAYSLALKKLDSVESKPNIKAEYAWLLDGLKARLNPIQPSAAVIEDVISMEGIYSNGMVQSVNKNM